MRILTEASGSLVSGFMTKSIKEAGHIAVGSDIRKNCHAQLTSNSFILMPKASDSQLWLKVEKLILENNIQLVIPSLDETLLGWAQRRKFFANRGTDVIISEPETVETFTDKWKTYEFFINHNVPTPHSSLDAKFPLIKPRKGRGSEGIHIINDAKQRQQLNMENRISQKLAKGQEYTIDCLFSHDSKPIYIIPRRRENVSSGKSLDGIVDLQPDIIRHIKEIAEKTSFCGPINVQLFKNSDKIEFIEINPRVAGGLALGFAASENWVPLIIDICNEKPVLPKQVCNGKRMYRYYSEAFS